MYKKMTAFALATGNAAPGDRSASMALSATAPNPLALRLSHSRRVNGR